MYVFSNYREKLLKQKEFNKYQDGIISQYTTTLTKKKHRIAPAFFSPVDRLLDRLRRSLDSEGTAREAQFFL